jgi:D-alanyl-lipoteichoic acid acyltransferase DltB (MBOAT superfamily)
MLFNSFNFFIFLPIVLALYWVVFSKNKTTQNLLLLLASYTFYSFWDWRFSFLLAFSTLLDYSSGLIINQALTESKKRLWMRLSIFTNLGLLCYFKYTNFFIDSFIQLCKTIGFHSDPYTLNIILPIGISFYTFHGVSYVLDIYYGRIKSQKNIIDYSLFVSFFPLLVAGPIERATHLLPQLKQKRIFNGYQGIEGVKLIIWGLFKKVVIADSLAPIVNDVFSNYQNYNSLTLILGVFFFAFQVYGDFSGYTDIARGVSKLLGIELILNFNFPYFSKTIPEFWSKWHISLSSWLNDYVFTPLALRYRDWGKHGMFISVTLTFLISGFWHGAAWHFVAWGTFHGLLYIPHIYSKKGLKSMLKKENNSITIYDVPRVAMTFSLVCVGYILFRMPDLNDSILYFIKIGNLSELAKKPLFSSFIIYPVLILLLDISLFIKLKSKDVVLERFESFLLIPLAILMLIYHSTNQAEFIYFAF